MPPRFVEVTDIGAEAASVLGDWLSRGNGALRNLSGDLTQYLIATTMDAVLTRLAEYHNISRSGIPDEWYDRLQAVGINASAPEEFVPEGRARMYILTAVVLVLTREVFVRWRVRRLLNKHGIHKH